MENEYFWSVAIEENSIQAAIWNIKDNAAVVFRTSNSVMWEDDDSLVAAADECLSSCIQDLPEGVAEPTKTVFGVPSFWVSEGQIQREHLDKIRLICNKLSLSPTGFVVLPEALAHLIKIKDKTPLSAVLIGVYPQSIDVAVYRLGNMEGNVNVSRSTNIAEDVIEGLARFGMIDPVPSRFLLYDSKMHDLEDIKQNLIKSDWDINQDVKFLHTPQVEVIESKEKMESVSLAGAAEMGQVSELESNPGPSEEKNTSMEEGLVDPSTLGFNINSDSREPEKSFDTAREIKKRFSVKFPFGKIPKFNGVKVNKILKGNIAYIGVIVVFFLLVGGFVGFWFWPKADITIVVAPKKIESKQAVKFDLNADSVNFSKLIVPAKIASVTVEGDKTKTTTGTKLTGTRATGTVTFYNVGGSTTVPSGTVLNSSSLGFTLNDDVTIASASGAASAATAQGKITASEVGADYNLVSGTYFTVGNFSTSLLQAKNDSDLSGGSSQEVTAVSTDDMNSLVTDLTEQLTEEGKNNLKTNLSMGNLLIDSTIVATPSAKNFDHKALDEATTLKLSMSAKVTGTTLVRTDMEDLAKNIFADKVDKGFVMKNDQIDFKATLTGTDFIINLLPQIDTDKLSRQILGKSESEARNILSEVPGFSDLEIKETRVFPFLHFLPRVPGNISITISAK